jgi:hypothetical protein
VPILTGENVYPPSAPVVMVTVRLVPSFVRLTLAPGTTAPDGSETVPRIVPVSIWHQAGAAKAIKVRIRKVRVFERSVQAQFAAMRIISSVFVTGSG